MAIEVKVEEGANAFVIKLTGHTNAEELSSAYGTVFESPHYRTDMNALWDICGTKLSQFQIAEVRKLARLLRGYSSQRGMDYKVAIATNHQADYQLLRLYITFFRMIGTFRMRVFNDLQKAQTWLLED